MTDMESNRLTRTGKRMPYRVPDGFFDALEDSVMSHVTATVAPRRPRWLKMLVGYGATAAAAALAVVLLTDTPEVPMSAPAVQFAEVETAFDQLSDADRDYLVNEYETQLLATYQQQEYLYEDPSILTDESIIPQ